MKERTGNQDSQRRTSFGFRDVDSDEKPALVRDVFSSVARRYDLMNDLMSGGMHRLWKQAMIDALDPRPGQRFIDVAGGTGDIAFRILKRLRRRGAAPAKGTITICDPTAEMLETGRARAEARGIRLDLDWIEAAGEDLPFADGTVDAYTIAFGMRNCTDIERVLGEARRVLRPGGRFLCLEFSQLSIPLLDKAYDLYSFEVIPRLGAAVTGDRDSYQYLVESIRRFPAQEEFAAMIAAAGLAQSGYRNLSGGVVALHSAWRV